MLLKARVGPLTLALGVSAAPLLTGTLAAQPASLSLSEVRRIGAVDGPAALSAIGGLAYDGTTRQVYVAQPTERVVRVVRRDGSTFTIGRSGSGPGEFQSVSSLGFRGDTLWVTDFAQSRVSAFSPAGEHLYSLRVATPHMPGISRPGAPAAVFRDGSILSFARVTRDGGAGARVQVQLALKLSRDGQVLDTLAVLDWEGRITRLSVGDRMVGFANPFSDASRAAVAAAPDRLVVVHAKIPDDDAPATFRVLSIHQDGHTIFDREYVARGRPVPAELDDELRANLLAGFQRLGTAPGLARRLVRDSVSIPAYQPPVVDALVGEDGRIWLRRDASRSGLADWTVLSDTGDVIGTARVPGRARLLYADASLALGALEDELDVPYIVVYEIR